MQEKLSRSRAGLTVSIFGVVSPGFSLSAVEALHIDDVPSRQNFPASALVDVGGGEIFQRLVNAPMVVVMDEVVDFSLQFPGRVVFL